MKPILERSRPRVSIQDFRAVEIKGFLRKRLAGRGVQEAYLFGSFAQGAGTAWSDLDVVIVKETDQPFLERSLEFQDLFDLGIPVDILVYTPQEFESLKAGSSPFWRNF
ncbi:MAG: nucleotidyltransferase domain-containing protein, partial [Deltaproteobacteria bacterium]